MKELLRRLALFLLIWALLSVSFAQALKSNAANLEEMRREMREMEVDDYGDPKPNVNPRSGALFTPPTPPTPPPAR